MHKWLVLSLPWMTVLLFFITGCQQKPPLLKESGTLTVVMRNAPTIYYEWHDEPAGFEYDMVRDFARYLGIHLKIEVVDTEKEVLKKIRNGEADLASASITMTDARKKIMDFGPAYYEVYQWVVCNKEVETPESIHDLFGKELLVVSGSSYVERLEELSTEYSTLYWTTTSVDTAEGLLQKVAAGEVECTVTDSNLLAVHRRYFPDLQPAFEISQKQSLAWALPKDSYRMQQKIQTWYDRYKKMGDLKRLEHKYYSYTEKFNYYDMSKFHSRIENRLPRYTSWFKKVGDKYGLSWKLLAAQAYQESHWNPYAKSPTGVRGLMMLTRDTARQVGVSNRLNPRQSIYGGAKHMNWLMKNIPEEVHPDDKIRYALAAYNVGFGHVKDAMMLAKRLKKDPYRWKDLSEVLPYLARKRYYRKLKHGYARGWEPVTYVSNIMNYYDILQSKEI